MDDEMKRVAYAVVDTATKLADAIEHATTQSESPVWQVPMAAVLCVAAHRTLLQLDNTMRSANETMERLNPGQRLDQRWLRNARRAIDNANAAMELNWPHELQKASGPRGSVAWQIYNKTIQEVMIKREWLGQVDANIDTVPGVSGVRKGARG